MHITIVCTCSKSVFMAQRILWLTDTRPSTIGRIPYTNTVSVQFVDITNDRFLLAGICCVCMCIWLITETGARGIRVHTYFFYASSITSARSSVRRVCLAWQPLWAQAPCVHCTSLYLTEAAGHFSSAFSLSLRLSLSLVSLNFIVERPAFDWP